MATVIEEEGKKVRQAISWIAEMCKQYPDKTRSDLINTAIARFDLSPKESDFLLRKLSKKVE